MDAIFYNNYIARLLNKVTGLSSFAIGPFILTCLSQGIMGTRTFNRLYTYTRQWTEITAITLMFTLVLSIFTVINLEWLILSPFMYYIWYVIEYFIKCLHNFFTDSRAIYDYDTSNDMAFHIEAEIAAYNPHYYEEDRFFSWIKFVFKRY